MYNGKSVTTEYIIERIQKDYGFNQSMDKYEIADDIFDAIELIGVPLHYVERITNGVGNNPPVINIQDYSAELPCDLRQIEGVRMHLSKAPLIEDTSTFKAQTGASNDQYDNMGKYLVYHVNDNFIFTNFEEGEIEITYLAFPTDGSGVPLIPDNTRYIQGIVAYVAERIGHREFFRKNLDRERYEILKEERLWYVPSAANSLRSPSYDQAESIKNQLSRMIKSKNHHAYGFKYLNSQEILKNHK